MSEYIKQSDAVMAIHQAAMNHKGITMEIAKTYDIARKSVEAIPAADVEPVVRCRDCVAYAGKERKGGGIMMICRINKHEASPEHFCSQGRNRAHMERSGSGE